MQFKKTLDNHRKRANYLRRSPAAVKETMKRTDVRNLFSRNLKRLRSIANLSQVNLASKADLAHNFINDIENGKKWVSSRTIEKLAVALKVEPYQFFISESKDYDSGTELFTLYLNDLQDSFEKMLGQYRKRFINGEEDAVHEKVD